MGVDGISFPLVMLTAAVSALAMGASWSITKNVKAYCILFLLLETGMLGVFLSLDFFLFYVFWEVMLLPMYFLIGVWGGPRREYAAIKFFLYTLVGSVLMLIAILLLYFHSDLRQVARVSDLYRDQPNPQVEWDRLHISRGDELRLGRVVVGRDETRPGAALELLRTEKLSERPLIVEFLRSTASNTTAALSERPGQVLVQVMLGQGKDSAANVAAAMSADANVSSVVRAYVSRGSDGSGAVLPADTVRIPPNNEEVHTFNILALAAVGQHTTCFDREMLFGWSLQLWAFLLLFIGFIVKVPSVPLHTWLPDAHVEAPTPISMILAGVLLKMGGYGIIRICYPICPQAGYQWAWFVCLVGVVSMVYGAFAAMAQKDFKRLVAYSSVSHMGYVVLGLGVWSARDMFYNADFWNMGVQGALFQMIAHGISSSGMFFMVGVVYDRVHHRNLDEFGGLFGKMPVYTALSIGIFFAGLGLPGLCGFIGEVFVVLSVFRFDVALAVISAAVVILTAGYILWAIQRVYLGSEYKGPHGDHLTPSNARENTIAGIIFVAAILFGIFPYHLCLRYMEPTVTRQVQQLSSWARRAEVGRGSQALAAFPDRSSSADDVEPHSLVTDVTALQQNPN
jgi:NADH-quinone oxidoreductase subunit M